MTPHPDRAGYCTDSLLEPTRPDRFARLGPFAGGVNGGA
jgi:hypothetical protein